MAWAEIHAISLATVAIVLFSPGPLDSTTAATAARRLPACVRSVAHAMAVARGCDPDAPRGLKKVTESR